MGNDDDRPRAGADGALATAMASLERNQRRFPEGQRRIFLAAIDAFSERGFHATTTRDIAARAGLSPAGLYVHFGSKEEVLHRISIAALRLTLQVAEATAATPGSPAQRLAATIRDLTVWHADHAPSVRVVLHHLTDLTDEHRLEVGEIQQRIHGLIRGLVAAGSADGTFDVPDPGATTVALLSLCVDTARWYAPGYRRTPDHIGADNAALALRMVAARTR
ncbi:TetR/AcrR family transcriptional regulator [Nocardia sp. NPDC088792]|uniref:TetR/AcrR family transcriptional regulator n=1 Tax=Nocardia sp. NPDC088792 TaxID=3364332 RepID=UPI003827CA8C